MARLSKRQLRTYAVVSQAEHGFEDLLEGLMPFFEPIILETSGEIFDSEKFASRVQEVYGWPFTSDIAEELISRFERHGWIENIAADKTEVIYKCMLKQKSDRLKNIEESVGELLEEISSEFRRFAQSISPLTSIHLSPSDFEELLLNWLLSIDGFDAAAIAAAANAFLRGKDQSTTGQALVGEASLGVLDQDESYLCARYIAHLGESEPEKFDQLVRISSIGMLTDVILDFHKPQWEQGTKADLMVVLDGPFLMQALGVSGKARQVNASTIISGFKTLGCRLAVFPHICDEVRDNLRAVLSQHPHNRFGPTGDAIRRNELREDFARSVLGDVEHYVNELGASIIQQNLDQFPNTHRYFDG